MPGGKGNPKVKKSVLAAVAAAALMTTPATAGVDMDSANYILPFCRGEVSATPTRHYTGVFYRGVCLGVVMTWWSVGPGFCGPHGVSYRQMLRVVVRWIEQRPERHHEPFAQLALQAMQAAWPCNPVRRQSNSDTDTPPSWSLVTPPVPVVGVMKPTRVEPAEQWRERQAEIEAWVLEKRRSLILAQGR